MDREETEAAEALAAMLSRLTSVPTPRRLELRDRKREYENIAARAAECLKGIEHPGKDSDPAGKLIYGALASVMSLANRGAEMTDELHSLKYAGLPEKAERGVVKGPDGSFFFSDDPLWYCRYETVNLVLEAGQSFYDASSTARTEDQLRAAYSDAERNARRHEMKRIACRVRSWADRGRRRRRDAAPRMRWAGDGVRGVAKAAVAGAASVVGGAIAARLLGWLP